MAENWQKIKNSQPQLKIYCGSYNKTVFYVYSYQFLIVTGQKISAALLMIYKLIFILHCRKVSIHWNNRRSRRVFLCFYSAIFQLTSAKF